MGGPAPMKTTAGRLNRIEREAILRLIQASQQTLEILETITQRERLNTQADTRTLTELLAAIETLTPPLRVAQSLFE